MQVTYARCCGLDVHLNSVVACRLIAGPDGKCTAVVRTFGTMTRDLLQLADWLRESGVTHVAMESTGVFWKPIWNILEPQFQILLVNARHLKQVPGRKTDVKDCEWIAQLLQHGLLKASFVPPRPIRELRDLTRQRAKLVSEKTSVVNRIHKILEDANIKLGSVASDVVGVSGRAILRAMVEGETDPSTLAEMARGRLRGKIPQLRPALEGHVDEHHRFMLKLHQDQLASLECFIERLDLRIEDLLRPEKEVVERLTTIPGFQRRAAENLVAEIGFDMNQFPSAGHLASWGSICPGNNESAGKRRSGKTLKANPWLRRALTEAAWGAARTKNTYAQAQYRRLVSRRGKKRAIVAVAHGLLIAAYFIIKQKVTYNDLGPDHFDRLNTERLTRYLVGRLEKLGHKVVLDPKEDAAA
jgi:transposase